MKAIVALLACLPFALVAAPAADRVDQAIERGLEFLLGSQQEDGDMAVQPWETGAKTCALPALAGMACLATGHVPGDAKYGKLIDGALDYILAHHDAKGYLGEVGDGKMYAHAIATLFLTEVSGMVSRARQQQIDELLPKALRVIVDAQRIKKDQHNTGGWRYTPTAGDSDTSCSGWCLMALRSARLNGAQVPEECIRNAVEYMHRHHNPGKGCFAYQHGEQNSVTLSGAGILCLELCGRHEDPASLAAAKFLTGVYREKLPEEGFAYYGLYYAAQGLFQLGGEDWKNFAEWMYATYLPQQQANGSWPRHKSENCEVYATTMTILAFAVPYRQLPVYQRDETVDE